MTELLVMALGLAAVAAFVVLPLVRRPAAGAAPADAGRDLLERRDRALAALRELEFDHRTGTIGDDDYARLLHSLRGEAAAALRAIAEARDA